MFRIHLPSSTLYVTPDQLPRILANLAETRYVAASGEFLQTTTTHEPAQGDTTATLLIKDNATALTAERNQFRDLFQDARERLERLDKQLDALKAKVAARRKGHAKR
jgi:hypothetical protein